MTVARSVPLTAAGRRCKGRSRVGIENDYAVPAPGAAAKVGCITNDLDAAAQKIRLSGACLCAKKAINRLSGDQNGKLAPSVLAGRLGGQRVSGRRIQELIPTTGGPRNECQASSVVGESASP